MSEKWNRLVYVRLELDDDQLRAVAAFNGYEGRASSEEVRSFVRDQVDWALAGLVRFHKEGFLP